MRLGVIKRNCVHLCVCVTEREGKGKKGEDRKIGEKKGLRGKERMRKEDPSTENKPKGHGWVTQLVRASPQYAKVIGSILGEGIYNNQ